MNAVANRISPLVRETRIPVAGGSLGGELHLGPNAAGLVIFVHGSGSSRHSPRNKFVARAIRGDDDNGPGTLLFDLLTRAEEAEDNITAALRFDIGFLSERLIAATQWIQSQPELRDLKLGYFGASTGAAAALVAAAKLGRKISAVVSRGGRPDLADGALAEVLCPTLLIVGGSDLQVLALNEHAFARLRCEKELRVVRGATHLFEEPGALQEAAALAADWFGDFLAR